MPSWNCWAFLAWKGIGKRICVTTNTLFEKSDPAIANINSFLIHRYLCCTLTCAASIRCSLEGPLNQGHWEDTNILKGFPSDFVTWNSKLPILASQSLFPFLSSISPTPSLSCEEGSINGLVRDPPIQAAPLRVSHQTVLGCTFSQDRRQTFCTGCKRCLWQCWWKTRRLVARSCLVYEKWNT